MARAHGLPAALHCAVMPHARRALLILATAALLAGAGAAAALAANGGPLRRVSPPRGAYTVELPSRWRFANASYPSDHATHLWYDPANALRKLLVVLSGCVGCAERNGQPDPRAVVPAGATNLVPLSRDAVAFQVFTDDDPWTANGIVTVIRQNGAIEGYATAELWLAPARHVLATAILNSFTLSG